MAQDKGHGVTFSCPGGGIATFNEHIEQALSFPIVYPYPGFLAFALKFLATDAPKGTRIREHTHPHYEFALAKGGSIRYTFSQKQYTLKDGEMIFIPPFVVHNRHSLSDVILYGFQIQLINTSAIFIGNAFKEGKKISPSREIQNAIKSMCAEIEHKEMAWKKMLKNNLHNTLTLFFRRLIKKQGKNASPLQELDPQFLEAVSYINQNIYSVVKPGKVAKALGLSERHLSRIFQKNIKMPPSGFITEKKLLTAYSRLSRNKNALVKAVALDLNFQDLSYFSRLMKKRFGASPKAIQYADY